MARSDSGSRGRRERPRRERGAAAVELALVLPLLLLILFGIVDFGRMFNAQITLTQAAREGARAASYGQTSAQVASRVDAAASGLPAAEVNSSAITTCPNGAGTATTTATFTFTFVTPFAVFAGMFGATPSGTYNLTSTAVVTCSS